MGDDLVEDFSLSVVHDFWQIGQGDFNTKWDEMWNDGRRNFNFKKMPPARKSGGGKSHFWAMTQIIYLYLVSFVALVILVINVGRVVHLGLEEWVFPIDAGIENSWEVDQCEEGGNLKGVVEPGEKVVKPTQEEIEACVARAEEVAARREDNNRNRTLASSTAFVLVSLPVWILHYRRARKMK